MGGLSSRGSGPQKPTLLSTLEGASCCTSVAMSSSIAGDSSAPTGISVRIIDRSSASNLTVPFCYGPYGPSKATSDGIPFLSRRGRRGRKGEAAVYVAYIPLNSTSYVRAGGVVLDRAEFPSSGASLTSPRKVNPLRRPAACGWERVMLV